VGSMPPFFLIPVSRPVVSEGVGASGGGKGESPSALAARLVADCVDPATDIDP